MEGSPEELGEPGGLWTLGELDVPDLSGFAGPPGVGGSLGTLGEREEPGGLLAVNC